MTCTALCQGHTILLLLPYLLFVSTTLAGGHEDLSSLLLRNTSSGLVQGRALTTDRGVTGLLFLGIPYGEAPIGALRFRPPRQVKPWKGVLHALNYGPACYYSDPTFFFETPMTSDQIRTPSKGESEEPMSEDCLLLDVFTTERCLHRAPGNGCAVLHYVYGGGFTFGSSNEFNPQFIVDNFANTSRDVVVVTVNYRMNVFGLLNLNYKIRDLLLPNIAMHDILESLRWTQREIANFGGDPKRVTLMGHSSGSSTVQILMVCPKAQPYFSQAVSLSGSGASQLLPKNRDQRASRRLAYLVNCVSSGELASARFWSRKGNVNRVLKCLRAKPAKELVSAVGYLTRHGAIFRDLSSEPSDAPDAIIPGHYWELVRNFTPSYPVLTGTVSKEYRDGRYVVDRATGAINTTVLRHYCRHLIGEINYARKEAATEACVLEYNNTLRVEWPLDDARYYVPHYEYARNSVAHGVKKVFLYQFEYDAIGAAFNRGRQGPTDTPRHSQDLVYLFGFVAGSMSAKDRRIQFMYSQLFANFINNGDPNGGEIDGFEALNPERMNYYKVDFPPPTNDSSRGGEERFVGDTPNYHRRAVEFWSELMLRIGGPATPLEDEIYMDDDIFVSSQLEREQMLLQQKTTRAHSGHVVLPMLAMWQTASNVAESQSRASTPTALLHRALLPLTLLALIVAACIAWVNKRRQRQRDEYLTL